MPRSDELRRAVREVTRAFQSVGKPNALVSGSADDAALLEPLEPAFYAEPAPGWGAWLRRYGARVKQEPRRVERMNKANPKYVFRNYLAQLAIDALEKGDASVMERLLKVLERPYDEQPAHHELAARRPEWARNRAGCSALSCSATRSTLCTAGRRSAG